MIGKENLGQKPVTLVTVKEILKERNADADTELSYEQKTAFDYSKKFAKLTKAKHEKILAELKAIEGLEEDFAVKLIDVMPEDFEVVKVLAHKSSKASEDDLKQAFEVVKKYLK
jgi:DNA-directed RNA polymerase subunit F